MSAHVAGSKQAPFIVGIGGTIRANSSTERAAARRANGVLFRR
jgi:FMN reductase